MFEKHATSVSKYIKKRIIFLVPDYKRKKQNIYVFLKKIKIIFMKLNANCFR
jgi:hypothetical protein